MKEALMRIRRQTALALAASAALALTLSSCSPDAASRGLSSIRGEDMTFSLRFLSSPEFRGRPTPSPELDIAARYIAMTAERIGLKPLEDGGTFLQGLPVQVTTLLPCDSGLRLAAPDGPRDFTFPADATAGRGFEAGRASGEIVFLGYGVSAPGLGWDDLAGLDLKGKIAVVLDGVLPDAHPLRRPENRRLVGGRATALRERGVAGIVTIIGEDRERRLSEKGLAFDLPVRLEFPSVVTAASAAAAPQRFGQALLQVEVRHAAAEAILGCTAADLAGMFASLREGRQADARIPRGRRLEVAIAAETRAAKSFNVVGLLEGSDPALRGEYLTISSHYDHNPSREGRIFPGADDNISGVAGMFELAEALERARPKRSVIFVWNTAEERGLIGSYQFVEHCPVPVEKISANLNLDMISRNDPGQIYLIGSNKLSSELDASIQTMNKAPGPGLKLDYAYESPAHPDRFFFRSDQYPYIRYGIPAVWFFCGTTEDYHTENDVAARVDYAKMEKVLRLVYRVAMDIAGKPALLKLDRRPEVTARGPQNMAVEWR
jgi:hypothetical protein